MSAQNNKTRPARNNSLQRMLELERRFMMERLQSSTTANPMMAPGLSKPVASTPAQNGHAQPAHFTIQTARPKTQAQHDDVPRRDAKPVPFRAALGQQQPPLTLNTAFAQRDQKPVVARGDDMARPSDSNPNVQAPPERLSSKVVSFNIPPEEQDADRGSICQSPSWEAYDRRKKDKLFEKKDLGKDMPKESKKELKKEPRKESKEVRKEREKELEQAKARLKEREKEKQKEREREKQREKDQEKQRQKDKEKLKEWQKQKEKEEKQRSLLTKTKRLSKTPPMSSIHAIDHANRMSRSLPTPPPDTSRPGSAAGRRSSSRDDTTNRRSHSRSSSISSLFRRPFENRHNTIEDTQDGETGFIGGIKLEMERHAALQKALDEQLKADKGIEAADIHPALRDDKPGAPQTVEAGAAGSSRKPVDAQRRAYPPITRLTSAAKTRSLVLSPTAAIAPEAATLDKWKAFVGIKTSPKQSPTTPEVAKATVAEGFTAPKGTGISAAKMPQPTLQASFSSEKAPTNSALTVLQMAQNDLKDKQIQASATESGRQKASKDKATRMMTIQTDMSRFDGPKLSPPLSPEVPIEIPARSPKRNSISSGTSVTKFAPAANHSPNCSSSSRFSSSNASAKGLGCSQDDAGSANSSIDSSGPGSQEPNGGGVPLDTKQLMSAEITGMKMPTWNEIRSTVVQAIASNVSLSNVRMSQGSIRDDSDFTVRRLTGISAPSKDSSDEISYEEFHSPSIPGTPDTSRAQSEKGAIPLCDIEQRLASQGDARPGSRESRRPTMETVGNAAQRSQPKVNLGVTASEGARMAVVNSGTPVLHMPQGRAVAQIRVTSETGVTQETSFLPKLKHQPLRPGASPSPSREKMMASSQPWAPASYLEEARKATPLAPPPQGVRSPSLAPRGGGGAIRTPPASVRSNPSSLNISGSMTPNGDPLAKMFVECCGCKYYHDMPSDLYEVMANPEAVISPRSSSGASSSNNLHLNVTSGASSSHSGAETSLSRIDLAGLITMRVRCPWCSHEMSTKCCAGYAAMVYLKQRLH